MSGLSEGSIVQHRTGNGDDYFGHMPHLRKRFMTSDHKYKNQKKFIAKRKAERLGRLVLWVKPEHKETFRELSRQLHMITRHLA